MAEVEPSVRRGAALLLGAALLGGCAVGSKPKPTPVALQAPPLPPRPAPLRRPVIRPIQVSSDIAATVCTPIHEIEDRKGPRAFFGAHVDSCKGTVPGDTSTRITVTGFDVMRGVSPARDAGIEPGDILVGFNGCVVRDLRELLTRMRQFRAGSVGEFTLLRKGTWGFERHDVLVSTVPMRWPGTSRAACAVPPPIPRAGEVEVAANPDDLVVHR